MTTATTNPGMATSPDRLPVLNRPNMVSVGTIVFLAQELMFFAGLFAMYFTSRANGMKTGDWAVQTDHLNVLFGTIITIVLVTSSVTSQLGVFAAEKGDVFGLRKWFTVTIALGVIFLGLVAYEWAEMVMHGVTPQSSVYGSVFYIITGFHMAHVTAGIIAFCIVMARVAKSKFTPAQATAAMVTSYYWHFVDVIWIGVFVTLYLVQ
ncbi:heme-copper oxidase subunit III [Corynebacterium genitalium ATCC 33030]|nr:heme-copper oxidase subunit III [Corynebacterium genitalium]MCQ4617818.1 heme-copper oxidase subunit III [Corynebacterium pseudogenitalium]MCQ4620748.1 heme-copper oxidase subunit III [Corynebacterium sp. CCUG 71335]MCQ4622712.1 heme-copper oxidase subunit III [Corynebacterium sp. CCUG 70398]MCQ4624564.1 heme-copper oxidase subunit III [Corynebacterium sp. CCUG 69979]MCQ4628088.1 heme-copper oxidase subunit III [Corynebacterium sp. CCUG 65737]